MATSYVLITSLNITRQNKKPRVDLFPEESSMCGLYRSRRLIKMGACEATAIGACIGCCILTIVMVVVLMERSMHRDVLGELYFITFQCVPRF